MDLKNEAEIFLASLKDDTSMDLMTDRMNLQVLEVIIDYAKSIARARKDAGLSVKESISSALIMGYLLRSHLERYELEQCLKINAFDF